VPWLTAPDKRSFSHLIARTPARVDVSLPTTYRRSTTDVHVCITVALLGLLYACVTAVLAGQGLVFEAQANSFLPYVLAPFACGVALVERRPQLAAVAGASIAVAMVVGFYGATQATSAFPIHSWGIEFWSVAALPVGAGAAVAGRAGAARLARSGPLRIALSLLLVGAMLADWFSGPSLYRTAEVLVAGEIVVLVVAALLNAEFAWLRNQHSRG
jgi:hypothetical protein